MTPDLRAALAAIGINPDGPRDYDDPDFMAWGETLADRRGDWFSDRDERTWLERRAG